MPYPLGEREKEKAFPSTRVQELAKALERNGWACSDEGDRIVCRKEGKEVVLHK